MLLCSSQKLVKTWKTWSESCRLVEAMSGFDLVVVQRRIWRKRQHLADLVAPGRHWVACHYCVLAAIRIPPWTVVAHRLRCVGNKHEGKNATVCKECLTWTEKTSSCFNGWQSSSGRIGRQRNASTCEGKWWSYK